MSETRESFGLSSQYCECGRARVLEEESGARVNPIGSADKAYAGETEETWRPLTRQRVVAFFQLFFVWSGLKMAIRRAGHIPRSPKRCWEPWSTRSYHGWTSTASGTRFECRWPMTLEQFHEVDNELGTICHGTWGTPMATNSGFFGDMERERAERRREEWERRQMEVRSSASRLYLNRLEHSC